MNKYNNGELHEEWYTERQSLSSMFFLLLLLWMKKCLQMSSSGKASIYLVFFFSNLPSRTTSQARRIHTQNDNVVCALARRQSNTGLTEQHYSELIPSHHRTLTLKLTRSHFFSSVLVSLSHHSIHHHCRFCHDEERQPLFCTQIILLLLYLPTTFCSINSTGEWKKAKGANEGNWAKRELTNRHQINYLKKPYPFSKLLCVMYLLSYTLCIAANTGILSKIFSTLPHNIIPGV